MKDKEYEDLLLEYARIKWEYRMEIAEYLQMVSLSSEGSTEWVNPLAVEEFLEATHSTPTGLDET